MNVREAMSMINIFNNPLAGALSRIPIVGAHTKHKGPSPNHDPRRRHNYRALGVTATCAVCTTPHREHRRNKRRSYMAGGKP